MKTKKEIKAELLKFANKHLDGNLDNFRTFQIASLKDDKEFGCPSRHFDPDDTNIMRLIYQAVFSHIWFKMLSTELENNTFRGDTLNTYNTMFGRPNETSMHPGLDKYNPSESLKAKAVEYYNRYYSLIGNFVPLPNVEYEGKTINRYRGCHPQWRDFADRFIYALRDALLGRPNADKGLSALIESNLEHFKMFKNAEEDGFLWMMEGLLLEDYLDANGNPVISSNKYHYWRTDVDNEDYCKEAERYLHFAKSVIEHRTELMIEKLKKFIERE